MGVRRVAAVVDVRPAVAAVVGVNQAVAAADAGVHPAVAVVGVHPVAAVADANAPRAVVAVDAPQAAVAVDVHPVAVAAAAPRAVAVVDAPRVAAKTMPTKVTVASDAKIPKRKAVTDLLSSTLHLSVSQLAGWEITIQDTLKGLVACHAMLARPTEVSSIHNSYFDSHYQNKVNRATPSPAKPQPLGLFSDDLADQ